MARLAAAEETRERCVGLLSVSTHFVYDPPARGRGRERGGTERERANEREMDRARKDREETYRSESVDRRPTGGEATPKRW